MSYYLLLLRNLPPPPMWARLDLLELTWARLDLLEQPPTASLLASSSISPVPGILGWNVEHLKLLFPVANPSFTWNAIRNQAAILALLTQWYVFPSMKRLIEPLRESGAGFSASRAFDEEAGRSGEILIM